jgi:hypothetical protein
MLVTREELSVLTGRVGSGTAAIDATDERARLLRRLLRLAIRLGLPLTTADRLPIPDSSGRSGRGASRG